MFGYKHTEGRERLPEPGAGPGWAVVFVYGAVAVATEGTGVGVLSVPQGRLWTYGPVFCAHTVCNAKYMAVIKDLVCCCF